MQQKKKTDYPRVLFLGSAAALAFGVIFGAGLYSGYTRNGIFQLVDGLKSDVTLVFSEAPNHLANGVPVHFLQPSRKPGSGVTVNERADDGGLILISSFFDGDNELRLIRRDGSIVARWPARFSQHFPDTSHLEQPPQTDHNVDLHGAVINPDGSVVFNYEYGGMVKLSRCGQTLWTLPHPTHHSIEKAEEGGYWVPGLNYLHESDPEVFPPLTSQGTDASYADDLILKVSEDGQITRRISVTKLLYDNGLEALLTATGYNFDHELIGDRDLVHLNKIAVLSQAMAAAFPQFKAGDLLISLRRYNLLVVVDPDTWTVKWHQTGPWLRQHDPEFDTDGTISMFNNNIYHLALGPGGISRLTTPRVSNILQVDPKTGTAAVAYGGKPGQEFLSVIRGKHQKMADGGFLITEFEGGRAFQVDAEGRTFWEFINRYDADRVLEITQAHLYPGSYFTVDDWTCPVSGAN